jgi:LmbE family N-acetylglucosaminyl deacetylase
MKGKRKSAFVGVGMSMLLAASLLAPLAVPTQRVQAADRGLVELWKSVKPLTTVASFMNTGAHPDDEHSATLAYVSLGKGVRTDSIIANRGEGGQNEIGSELGNALGIIRTRELQEASKITNVTVEHLSEKINDPIYDFGFSKSPDETLQKWGEQTAYERLIRKIRQDRPDVLLPSFLNEPSTHGHHRAISILTVRAFNDAGNPNVFPEHLKMGLKPWQPKKLYLPADEKNYTLAVPVGTYNQVYGATYVQLGEESRYMHKSQGMGKDYVEAPENAYYKLEKSVVPVSKDTDFFTGIPYTFADLAKQSNVKGNIEKDLRKLGEDAQKVTASYPSFENTAKEIHKMKADLQVALNDMAKAKVSDEVKTDILYRLHVKEDQLNKASAAAMSLIARVIPQSEQLIPGQTTKVTVTAYNGGNTVLTDVHLNLNVPSSWQVKALGSNVVAKLGHEQTAKADYEITVPKDAPMFDPYAKPTITANVSYNAYGTQATQTVTPKNAVGVLPPYSLALDPGAAVLNTAKSERTMKVNVKVRSYVTGASQVSVSLKVPQGWSVSPNTNTVSFGDKNQMQTVEFTVKAPEKVADQSYTIQADAKGAGLTSTSEAQVISYPHIGTTYYVKPAELKVQAADINIPQNLKVGYVSSGFDTIDQTLRQLGVNVTNLDDKAIQSGDLSQYDTIVLGIRAYGFRPDLLANNQRLLDYVKNGGNLLVQYHKPEDKWKPSLAPYPITIGPILIQWRVTDENSKVTMLAPEHRIFNEPNKITDKDWDNWIQDRSAYNPSEWGKEYTTLISNGDPGEKPFTGTILTAPYGKGTYTYTSMVWYREVPALVPGALRMFTNMISLHQ